jgi:hypothetical protein
MGGYGQCRRVWREEGAAKRWEEMGSGKVGGGAAGRWEEGQRQEGQPEEGQRS